MSKQEIAFKDHFSGHAQAYASYRPHYPDRLFQWLSQISPGHSLAWDCATGNGQAAIALAEHFDQVIASDASSQQIDAAIPHPRVQYRVEPAENCAHKNESVDLITAGQAYHWFEHARFHAEAKRILKPGGVLALWTYKLAQIDPRIDSLVYELYEDVLGNYWQPERDFIDQDYRDFELPWPEISTPEIQMQATWTLSALTGYLDTWSALRRYVDETGTNPLEEFSARLAAIWGDPEQGRMVNWPLIVRACRKPA